jgi:hypothetical protein
MRIIYTLYKMSEWIKFVKKTHADIKKKNGNAKFKDTLIHCGKIWKSKSMAKKAKSTTRKNRKTKKNNKH